MRFLKTNMFQNIYTKMMKVETPLSLKTLRNTMVILKEGKLYLNLNLNALLALKATVQTFFLFCKT